MMGDPAMHPTFANGLSAGPLAVGAASAGALAHEGVAVLALVADHRVVAAGGVDGLAMARVLRGAALNRCNHIRRTPQTK